MSFRRLVLGDLLVSVGCSAAPEQPQLQDEPAPAPAPPRPVTAVSGGGANYETVSLTLPQGDPDAGRQAFIDLRCTSCHQVTGESALSSPVSQSPGPELGAALAERPAGSLATAIVAPSHAMSIQTSPETRANVEGVLSPMGDYSDTMTVRQLLDMIAYLHSR